MEKSLTESSVRALAKELTITALQCGMIKPSPVVSKTAEDIVSFYEKLIEKLK